MNSVFENPYVSGEKSVLSKLIEKDEETFEDQLINAADELYRNNMGLPYVNEDQQYDFLIKAGFNDDVAVMAIEDFNETGD